MRKTAIVILIGITQFFPNIHLYAGVNETLPTYHWVYEHVEELRLRGFLLELNLAKKPFTRGEIAGELVDMLIAGWAMDDMPKAVWLLDELYVEFAPEMNHLRKGDSEDEFFIGLLTQAGLKDESNKTDDTESFRIKGGFQVGDNFAVYNTMNFDSDLPDDPTYIGSTWRGLSAFSEQAYLRYETERFSILFGRDFQRWGVGRAGTLLISDYSRPFDQLYADLKVGPVELSFLAAELDKIVGRRRFISAHRIDIHIGNSFNIGVSEMLIYGGIHASPLAAFSNPVLVFHGENLNDENNQANTLGSIDLLWYPKRNWRLSAALLIDDIQLDNKVVGDLEPNEIGILLGLQTANPLGFDGVDLWAEYVRITNRTYTTSNIEETLIHRNRPIGYFLGNDFDSMELGASAWIMKGLKVSTALTFIRDGEGGIDVPFSTPWLNVQFEDGYSEPFPTGIVQEITSIEIKAEKSISNKLRLRFEYERSSIENFGNVEGIDESDNRIFIGFWYDLIKTVTL